MKLIEFLVHNWYLAVVLFFLISAFMKRRGSAPKQAMPPFGGGGGTGWGRSSGQPVAAPAANRREVPAQQRRSLAQQGAEAPDTAPVSTASSNEGDTPPADFWKDTEVKSSRPHSLDRAEHRPSGSPFSSYSNRQDTIDAETLAQGIIWSEILGPPRAKRPFRK